MAHSFYAALAVLLLAGPPHARSDALTLEQAVALGLERAPQLEVQVAALDAARAESTAAGRLPDPELLLALDNVPATGGDAWSLDRDIMTMRKIGVMQAFPNRAKRASRRSRAWAAVSLAESESRQAELMIARSTAASWVEAYSAEFVLEKLYSVRQEVQLQAQATRTALASGRGSAVDAITAQSEVSELDDRILQAEGAVQAARAELARWIGDDDARRSFASAPALMELPLSRIELLSSLDQQAPLLTFESQLDLARSEVDLARAQKRPDWSAQLAYAKQGVTRADMVSLEFRVGLPLFSRSRQDPVVRARRAELVAIEAERDAVLRAQAAAVTAQLAIWDAARQRIELYEKERLPLARQRSQAAAAGFRAGRVDLLDVLASHVAEIEIHHSHAALVKELGQAWVFLRYLRPEQLSP
jgi:outer membrane protein TolC